MRASSPPPRRGPKGIQPLATARRLPSPSPPRSRLRRQAVAVKPSVSSPSSREFFRFAGVFPIGRRLRRYNGVSVFDFAYPNNSNGGLKIDYALDYQDTTTEVTSRYKVSVNLDLNDFYVTPVTRAIALNLTNKIDGTLNTIQPHEK